MSSSLPSAPSLLPSSALIPSQGPISEHHVLIETPRVEEPRSDYIGPSEHDQSAIPIASPYPQHEYKRHCRECHAIRISDACMAMCCPCIPAAQVASALGKSYKWTLLLYGAIYLASGFSFLFAFVNALVFCAVWQFKWCIGGIFAETFFVILVKLDLDTSDRNPNEDHFSRRYDINDGTLYVCLVLEWLLVAYIWYLRFQWTQYLQREERGCTDCCAAAYCGCCVLAELASDVKRQSTVTACFGAVDTIPPYGYEDGVEWQYKLPLGCEKWPI